MKVALVFCAVVYVSQALNCFISTTDGEGATTVVSTACTDGAATLCNRPMFVEYTGVTVGDYACGPCLGTTEADGTCEECDTTDCNTEYTVTEYQCYQYQIASGVFQKKTDPVDCKVEAVGAMTCFNRKDGSTDETPALVLGGCGNCDSSDDANCEACTTDLCNTVALKCFISTTEGEVTTVVSTTCTGDETVCNRPGFVEYTGVTAGDYACGECDSADKLVETCVECSTTDCNTEYTVTEYQCYQYEIASGVFQKKTVPEDCKVEAVGDRTCFHRKDGSVDETPALVLGGCGDCSDSDDANCEACTTDLCNTEADVVPLKCFISTTEGEVTTVVSTACTGGETVCNMPAFAKYTGVTVGDYACGPCPGNTGDDGTCVECDTADCNTEYTVTEYQCYQYEIVADVFQKKDALQDCKVEGAGDVTCFKRKDDSTDATAGLVLGGCGDCSGSDVDSCVACDKDKCNGAAALTLLLPVMAALYMML